MDTDDVVMEDYIEHAINPSITCSLDSCKNKFFNYDIEGMRNELKSGKFVMYVSEYIYNNDFYDRPAYIVKDFVNDYIQQLINKRMYLFASFRILRRDNNYTIICAWITNSFVPFPEIVGNIYADFIWRYLECNELDINELLNLFARKDEQDENTSMVAYLF